jgi:potassium channel subfamily K protein 9
MKKQNVRTLSFIVSTVTYLLIGAAIFDALESQTEEITRYKLELNETQFKKQYNITDYEMKYLESLIKQFHFNPYKTYPQWKFTGAFYFSLTVITTIGKTSDILILDLLILTLLFVCCMIN